MKKTVSTGSAIGDLKAGKIAGRLFNEFYNRKGFFQSYSMPEYILPRNLKEGSREHALFLTYVISIDYTPDAVKLWKKSRRAHELYPEHFTPEKILKASPRSVESFVKKLGAGSYSNVAKTWVKTSRILTEKHEGDPRNTTKEPSRARENLMITRTSSTSELTWGMLRNGWMITLAHFLLKGLTRRMR
jgi:hypothetical protein